MFKFKILILSVCFAFIINACTSTSSIHTLSEQDNTEGLKKLQGNINFAPLLQLPDGLSSEKWMMLNKSYDEKFRLSIDKWLITSYLSQDWRSLDKSGRNIIYSFERSELAFQVEQIVAYTMIRGFLLHTLQSQETQDAMSYYMDILLKNKWVSHAKTIVEALEYVRPAWGDEKVQKFADQLLTFREERQKTALRNHPSSEEEYLRRRAKNTVEANPELFAGQANAEERLLAKLKHDREEARKKSQSPEIAEQLRAATLSAMAEEQEQEIYLQKLSRIAKTK